MGGSRRRRQAEAAGAYRGQRDIGRQEASSLKAKGVVYYVVSHR
jgi:hypothetical protein